MLTQDLIHQRICQRWLDVQSWFVTKKKQLQFSIYCSFDIRDSGYKIAPVDANIFPAGFNNICQNDKDTAVDIMREYLQEHYPHIKKHIALIAEEHTQNRFYWDNVATIRDLIAGSGYQVSVAIPQKLAEPLFVESMSGQNIQVHSAIRDGAGLLVNGEAVEFVICNNDFTNAYSDWTEGLTTPMNPPFALGWYRRRKSHFFQHYNQLARELAELLGVDSSRLEVATEVFPDFDINDEASRDLLAQRVDEFCQRLAEQYQKVNLDQKPYVYIKNSSGTYGLGVTQVGSGDDVRNWSYKARKKMKAAKGGGGFSEVIIQEGIPTRINSDGDVAEPAIYMIGCQLAGGFLRTHSEKSSVESLNSPGAIYKRLCVSDLAVNTEGCPMENVYGWIAKLGTLAIAYEAQAQGVEYRGYQHRDPVREGGFAC